MITIDHKPADPGGSRQTFTRRELVRIAGACVASSLLSQGAALASTRQGASKRVVIIGAGLAGLVSGYELTQAGHQVTILEAQTRAGGRVLTLRDPFSDGLYAEAGALFIPDNHDLSMKYVRQFDLPTWQVMSRGMPQQFYVRGKHISVRARSRTVWPLDLTEEEQTLGLGGMWEKYIGFAVKDMGDPTVAGWPPSSLQPLDQMTMTDLMRSKGASAAAVSLLRLDYIDLWGEGCDAVSALTVLRDYALRQSENRTYALKGGNDQLPKAFASRLKAQIRYGAAVTRIEREGRLRVIYKQAGVDRRVDADHVICAIPFSTLKRIEVTPPFSERKQAAITQLPYTSVARVFLQSRRKFWEEQGLPRTTSTDLPIQWVWEPTINQTGPRGILESYMAGANARRITAMPEKERLKAVLADLEKVYPGMTDNFEGGASKCWDEDEWARGDYAWFKPGQLSGSLRGLEKPEGRVHFAGEHASPWPAWMQGALYSGLRAVREINEAA